MLQKEAVFTELRVALDSIPEEQVVKLEDSVCTAREVFCCGSGRSGLCIQGFAMRLMHLGLRSNVIGNVLAHPVAKGDLLILLSATAKSDAYRQMMQKAHMVGAKVALITTSPKVLLTHYEDSPGAALADVVVPIAAQTKDGGQPSILPMGSIFEETSSLLFNLIVVDLMKRLHITHQDMVARHANIE